MDLPRPRRADVPSELARRRLELLGAQLEPSRRPLAHDDDLAASGDRHAGDDVDDADGRRPDLALASGVAGRHRATATVPRREVIEQTARALRGDRPVRRQHVLVGVVVVVLALVATLWWVAGSRPEEVRPLGAATEQSTKGADGSGASTDVLGTPGPDAASAAPGSGPTDAAPPSASAQVVVDVTGKVRRPGIVTLPSGSRVADAVAAAGGSRPGADLSSINLARVLVDGEQVVVGLPAVATGTPGTGPTGRGATSGAPDGPAGTPVNLNTATLEQLDTLPGIGPVTAQAILDHRAQIGRFTSVDDLMEVRGIGDARMADLRDLVTV